MRVFVSRALTITGGLFALSLGLLVASEAGPSAPHIRPAEITRRVAPEYPPELFRSLTDGSALVECVVGTDGRVQQIKVVSESHAGFGRAAAAALEQWEFAPGTNDGLPVLVPFVFECFPKAELEKAAGRQVFFEVSDPVIPSWWLSERPRPRRNLSPLYPAELAGSGKYGRAIVNITIDKEGRVINPRLIASTYREFALPALMTAMQLEFPPQVMADREPVYVSLDVQFDLMPPSGGSGPSRKAPPPAVAQQGQEAAELASVVPTVIPPFARATHVVFIVDSSGSMRDPVSERLWPVVLQVFDHVLDAFPTAKGIQVLDANGRFILGGAPPGGPWLPDGSASRSALKTALSNYSLFTNSDPAPGVVRALTSLYQAHDVDMQMSVVILGDEFTGNPSTLLRRLDKLNPKDASGRRKVVINAIGFPLPMIQGVSYPPKTMTRFANLMWQLCAEHGGSFVPLRDLHGPGKARISGR